MEIQDRRNINRGYKKLDVWKNAISIYVLICKMTKQLGYDQTKVRANIIDAAHSISRNIAEGYCRRSKIEYLNFLNYSLGSAGELHSSYFALHAAELITSEQYEAIDELHYKTENQLLKLIESISKISNEDWLDSIRAPK